MPDESRLQSSLLSSGIVYCTVYRTIILSVFIHGIETLSLALMEEHRLRVFENRVLEKIFRSRGSGRRLEKITY
jgi:hypothetical protein